MRKQKAASEEAAACNYTVFLEHRRRTAQNGKYKINYKNNNADYSPCLALTASIRICGEYDCDSQHNRRYYTHHVPNRAKTFSYQVEYHLQQE